MSTLNYTTMLLTSKLPQLKVADNVLENQDRKSHIIDKKSLTCAYTKDL